MIADDVAIPCKPQSNQRDLWWSSVDYIGHRNLHWWRRYGKRYAAISIVYIENKD